VQAVKLVRDPDGPVDDGPEPGPPAQLAAASATTAASAAHALGQRPAFRSPDAVQADRMPAMLITFCRICVAN
jgi:hypothetical protein